MVHYWPPWQLTGRHTQSVISAGWYQKIDTSNVTMSWCMCVLESINLNLLTGFHGSSTLWSLPEAILWLVPCLCWLSLFFGGVQWPQFGSICCCYARNVRRVQALTAMYVKYGGILQLQYYCHSKKSCDTIIAVEHYCDIAIILNYCPALSMILEFVPIAAMLVLAEAVP